MASRTKFLARVDGFFAVLGAARATAAAVEAHRTPDPRALKTLGIDPAAFKSVNF